MKYLYCNYNYGQQSIAVYFVVIIYEDAVEDYCCMVLQLQAARVLTSKVWEFTGKKWQRHKQKELKSQ